jgi:hypothetical protein
LKNCDIASTAKFVCLLYTTLNKVIDGFEVKNILSIPIATSCNNPPGIYYIILTNYYIEINKNYYIKINKKY